MYTDFNIQRTYTGSYVVRANSERFGKQAIVFEHYSFYVALAWIKQQKALANSVKR